MAHGIDVFYQKFNKVSPRADMPIYFPFTEKAKRLTALHGSIESLIYDRDQNDEHMWELCDVHNSISSDYMVAR